MNKKITGLCTFVSISILIAAASPAAATVIRAEDFAVGSGVSESVPGLQLSWIDLGRFDTVLNTSPAVASTGVCGDEVGPCGRAFGPAVGFAGTNSLGELRALTTDQLEDLLNTGLVAGFETIPFDALRANFGPRPARLLAVHGFNDPPTI